MAKIVFGGLVSDARNKEGGLIYSRARGGAYSKAYVKPIQPNTALQLAMRLIGKNTQARWNTTLTDAQRELWNAYADANPYSKSRMPGGRRSGNNWFSSINLKSQNYYGTWQDSPPETKRIYDPGGFLTVTTDVAANKLIVTFPRLPSGTDKAILWGTKPLSGGITRLYTGLTGFSLYVAGDPNPKNVYYDYISTIGPLAAGNRVGLKLNGIASDSLLLSYPYYKIITCTTQGDSMLYARTTLTNAQVLTLPTTPVQILAAVPGAIITIDRLVLTMDSTAGAYTNISATTNQGIYAGVNAAETLIANGTALLGSLNKFTCSVGGAALATALASDGYNNPILYANLIGLPLKLRSNNAGGNYTGGNAANVLTVDIYYSLTPAI